MNSFGRLFRVTIFGESHGSAIGISIDGCPAGIALPEDDFMADLGRRKSGAPGTTPRKEPDAPRLISGVFNGFSTGAPVTVLFDNTNVRSRDYSSLRDTPRPGHADFVASRKFAGYEDYRGGGHFSGRLTLGLVAAGVIAKKIAAPMTFNATLIEAGGREDIESAIREALAGNDSIGGIVECRIAPVPVGLGEPFFDSVESQLSHMMFAIGAIKGIEFGAGFGAVKMKGSEHNDMIISRDGTTATNHAGGINGGITNGNEIVFRVAVKPTSSTGRTQQTMNMKSGKVTGLKIEGRHDACIALRLPPVIEAGASIVMADLLLLEQNVQRIKE
jgi:chorismate synthase